MKPSAGMTCAARSSAVTVECISLSPAARVPRQSSTHFSGSGPWTAEACVPCRGHAPAKRSTPTSQQPRLQRHRLPGRVLFLQAFGLSHPESASWPWGSPRQTTNRPAPRFLANARTRAAVRDWGHSKGMQHLLHVDELTIGGF